MGISSSSTGWRWGTEQGTKTATQRWRQIETTPPSKRHLLGTPPEGRGQIQLRPWGGLSRKTGPRCTDSVLEPNRVAVGGNSSASAHDQRMMLAPPTPEVPPIPGTSHLFRPRSGGGSFRHRWLRPQFSEASGAQRGVGWSQARAELYGQRVGSF